MDVRLPQLAEGADSGTVVNLLVSEGQAIQKDQVLLELENQKAVAPIPSPASGTVGKIHVKMGDLVTVGQLLVTLTSAEGAGQGPVPSLLHIPTQEIQEVAREATQAGSGQFRSGLSPSGAPPPSAPSVRKLARQLGIDLSKVPGSGRGERITDQDLRRYLTQLQQVAGGGSSPTPGAAASSEQIDFSKWGPVKREPLSPLRVAIGKAMIGSWNTIPHVTQFGEADITKILALKKKYAPQYEGRGGPLTLTSFLLDAVAKVLKKFPIFNSSLDETAGELVFKQSIHLGIAVDTPGGLIVPVLREADRKNLLELSRELKDLAERTRERKISLEELQGATFSVSNQGGIGGTHFTPIIHRPEVAVLGVGRGMVRAVFLGKKLQGRSVLPLSLSYDHRVIDGADAARFIRTLSEILEAFPEAGVTLSPSGERTRAKGRKPTKRKR